MIVSCSDKLDFNQINNYIHKPVLTSALTYFKVVPFQFFDSNGVQQFEIRDVTRFEGFENTYIRENVVKINFNAEIKNEFNRDVTIQAEFLSENDGLLYSFTPIQVQENDLNFTYLEEIDVTTNQSVLNTAKVRIIASIENTGTPMNPNDTSEFEFKSSITFFIESEL
ncbi:hypothetical protein BTO18_08545 [Polaribacter porphyrae]|uniref:Uncharacterized protein n=2 Tax=Polaribacter porphyrae TaxID=1137780 RepID=A0A2S7WP34_9FLAO|nr:hypothetical protein [Polaribacter porphyrae]PQJ79216.1 hypothetical protein BTO18_08545 [Polaribacter porphyrae]